jgi:hypothetical protein
MQLVLLLTLLVGGIAFPSASVADEIVSKTSRPVPRVRAADNRVAAAMKEGLARSASFRAIIDHINTLDVIVYAETQPLLRGRLSGTMTWVTATKEFRYVRVSLNPDLNIAQMTASLAHELQHVVEVGEAKSIVDTKTLSDYYRVAGVERYVRADEWDTEAAQRTGDIVRRELADAYNNDAAQSIQARRLDRGR